LLYLEKGSEGKVFLSCIVKTSVALFLQAIFALLICSTLCIALDIPDGPYFGQETPGPIPKIFAPGIISLPNRGESHCIFLPDGNECLLSVTRRGNWPNVYILYFKQANGHWKKPIIAPFSNRGICNTEPTFSYDGQKVFFSSSRRTPDGRTPAFDVDIWVTKRTQYGWSEPVWLPPPVNSNTSEWCPSVAKDDILYFSSYRYRPEKGHLDLYRSVPKDGLYRTIEHLGSNINGPRYDTGCYIAPDESFIIFTRSDPWPNEGPGDMFISFRQADNSWTAPKNLGPNINTSGAEKCPVVSPDGKYLFFGRNALKRPSDIYWVDMRAVLPDPNGPIQKLSVN